MELNAPASYEAENLDVPAPDIGLVSVVAGAVELPSPEAKQDAVLAGEIRPDIMTKPRQNQTLGAAACISCVGCPLAGICLEQALSAPSEIGEAAPSYLEELLSDSEGIVLARDIPVMPEYTQNMEETATVLARNDAADEKTPTIRKSRAKIEVETMAIPAEGIAKEAKTLMVESIANSLQEVEPTSDDTGSGDTKKLELSLGKTADNSTKKSRAPLAEITDSGIRKFKVLSTEVVNNSAIRVQPLNIEVADNAVKEERPLAADSNPGDVLRMKNKKLDATIRGEAEQFDGDIVKIEIAEPEELLEIPVKAALGRVAAKRPEAINGDAVRPAKEIINDGGEPAIFYGERAEEENIVIDASTVAQSLEKPTPQQAVQLAEEFEPIPQSIEAAPQEEVSDVETIIAEPEIETTIKIVEVPYNTPSPNTKLVDDNLSFAITYPKMPVFEPENRAKVDKEFRANDGVPERLVDAGDIIIIDSPKTSILVKPAKAQEPLILSEPIVEELDGAAERPPRIGEMDNTEADSQLPEEQGALEILTPQAPKTPQDMQLSPPETPMTTPRIQRVAKSFWSDSSEPEVDDTTPAAVQSFSDLARKLVGVVALWYLFRTHAASFQNKV